MDNIYMLADAEILHRMAARIKSTRLKQNLSQQTLAEDAGVSLSSVIRVENGDIKSFDTLLRLLRTLGKLEILTPLVEDERLSPNEYYRVLHEDRPPARKRAAKPKTQTKEQEEVEW